MFPMFLALSLITDSGLDLVVLIEFLIFEKTSEPAFSTDQQPRMDGQIKKDVSYGLDNIQTLGVSIHFRGRHDIYLFKDRERENFTVSFVVS